MTEIEVLEKIAESLTWVQVGITVMAVIAGAAFILALLAWEEYR